MLSNGVIKVLVLTLDTVAMIQVDANVEHVRMVRTVTKACFVSTVSASATRGDSCIDKGLRRGYPGILNTAQSAKAANFNEPFVYFQLYAQPQRCTDQRSALEKKARSA